MEGQAVLPCPEVGGTKVPVLYGGAKVHSDCRLLSAVTRCSGGAGAGALCESCSERGIMRKEHEQTVIRGQCPVGVVRLGPAQLTMGEGGWLGVGRGKQ